MGVCSCPWSADEGAGTSTLLLFRSRVRSSQVYALDWCWRGGSEVLAEDPDLSPSTTWWLTTTHDSRRQWSPLFLKHRVFINALGCRIISQSHPLPRPPRSTPILVTALKTREKEKKLPSPICVADTVTGAQPNSQWPVLWRKLSPSPGPAGSHQLWRAILQHLSYSS